MTAKHRQLSSLIRRGKFDFIYLQETKREIIESMHIGLLWGNQPFDWSLVPSRSLSRGILSYWLIDWWSISFSF